MATFRLVQWLPFCLWFAGACAPRELECETVAEQSHAIKLATSDAGLARVPAADALVAIAWQAPTDTEALYLCTGTRIAADVYLTARHCVPKELLDVSAPTPPLLVSNQALGAGTTAPCGESALVASIERITVHPTYDLALLHSAPSELEQAPTMSLSKRSPTAGQQSYIAGFGLTEDATLGDLRALPATILDVNSGTITVQAEGGGACVGDSGGPLYAVSEVTSEPILFGVLSTGSASCLHHDQYVDTATLGAWFTQELE